MSDGSYQRTESEDFPPASMSRSAQVNVRKNPSDLAADLLINPAYNIPKQNHGFVQESYAEGKHNVGGLYRLKQTFMREFPLLADAGVPVSVKTQVDHKRVLTYVSLFILPLVLSIVVLCTQGLFVFDVAEYRGVGSIVTYTYGFFGYCVSMKRRSGDILAFDTYYPDKKCYTYYSYCGRFPQSYGTMYDPLPMAADRSAICGGTFGGALALHFVSLIFGLFGLLCLVDNVFVWLNLSFWYQPSHHKSDSIRRIRRWFKGLTFTSIALHMIFAFASTMLLRNVKRSEHYFPYIFQYGYGFWISTLVWIFDCVFVIVFWILNRRTFFAVPMYKNGTEAKGYKAQGYMEKHPV